MEDTVSSPGDDVDAPAEGEVEHIGQRFIRTIVTTHERPTRDPVLGQGSTDFDGRVMFALRPSQVANTAGFVTATTIIEDIRTGEIETTTRWRPLLERAADIFFRVAKSGSQVDTRRLPDGLTVNLNDKHLGSPDEPLTFPVRLELVLHP